MKYNLLVKAILACTFLIGGITPAWSAAEYSTTDVFVSGTEGYSFYRIPAIVKATNGTLLAFCEGRKTSSSDEGDIDIVLKRSSDNGLTWGSLILVQEEGGNAAITIGNPVPVVDASTGYIHLLFCQDNDTVYHSVSTNNGLTWSTRTEITDDVKLSNWSWYATGPCHAVQLTRGDQAGRLVVPANHTAWNASTSSMENGAHVIYSDDHGATWHLGAYFEYANGSAPNETTIVELNTPGDGGTGSHVYINSRDYGSDTGTRAEAWSGDGGSSYSVPYEGNSHFYTPICEGSLLRFSAIDEGDAMNRIIYSGPYGSTTYRVDGSLWTSTDEAVSWSSPKLLFSGNFSYSDMVVTDTGHLGILAECNASGSYSAYIKFIRVNEEWLDEPPPPTLPVVVDVDFSNFSAGSYIWDGDRIQDTSGSDHHGFWGDASGSYSIVSTGTGVGIDTTTSTNGYIYLRDGMSVTEDWFSGTTPSPYFTLLATNNYTFEAVVNFNGRSWDGAGKDGLMGQTGGNEAYIRTEDGFLQYSFVGSGNSVSQWGIDIKSAYDGEFHAIAVVLDRSAGEIRAYLDGQLLHTNTDADIASLGEMLTGTADFRLGAYNDVDADAFNGIQDRYRISSFVRDSADLLPPDSSASTTLPVVVDVDFSNFNNVSSISDGAMVQDSSESEHHGYWGDATGSYSIVSTGSGVGIDTTTSDSGYIFLRDGLSVNEEWFSGTTPVPGFTLLATNNYTFEAVVNFNGRSWDGAGKDGLMGQTGGNEAYIRTEDGFLQYNFVGNGVAASQWSIDIKSAYDGAFHSIAVVLDRSAGEIRAYLDGQLLHTNTDADIPALGDMLNGTADFRLGAYNTTGVDAFNGIQDRYRISSFARDPADFLPPEPSTATTLPVVVDVDFSNFNNVSSISDGDRVQDLSGSEYHGYWGNASGNNSIVSTGSGYAIDTTTSSNGCVLLRDGLSLNEEWFSGTTPIPYFTLLAASNYTFEAVVNFNGRSWDGAGKDGLMGQTGGNEAYVRTENGNLQYKFASGGVSVAQWGIDIQSAYDGEFHAIAVVLDRSAGEIRAYLDGALLHTNTDSNIALLGDMLNGTSDFRLGAYNATGADAFNGLQNRYRISSYARDAADLLPPEPFLPPTLPVVVDVDFSNFSGVLSISDGDRVQDSSGSDHHGYWGDASGSNSMVSTGSGYAIDTTTSSNGCVLLRDGLSLNEEWFAGTTPIPYFTLLAASNYTFEAVVNFNGRSWDGAGKDGLMGQTGGNEAYIRTENGNLQYKFFDGGVSVAQWGIDIQSAYDGEFHAIAIVLDRSAGEIRTYLDGALLHTNTDSNIALLGDMLDGTSDFRLGAYNATGVDAFNGLQDRYRISSFARDPADLLSADPSPPVNQAPVFTVDPINEANATEDIAYAGSVANATDADGDTLSYSKLTGPAWLTVGTDGSLSGTPAQSDAGANVFTVEVDDGNGGTDTATLNITVDAVNDAPAFTVDPINEANATEDIAYAGSVANATDAEGDTLSYSKLTGPAWLTVGTDGSLSGTPAQSDAGANVFTVQVDDGNGGTDTATLNITVDAVNDAPVFTVDPINEANATEGVAYAGSVANATDAEGDTLSYSKLTGPAWLTVGTDGSLSGTPAQSDAGANVFTVQVDDGNGGTDTATLNITVELNSTLPVVVDVDFSNFSTVSTIADGDRVQDLSGSDYHGFWGNASGSYSIVSTGSGYGVDTTTSTNGYVLLRDGLSVSEDWFAGTTVTPYFTLLAASNYTFEAVVNFNGRTWDGAGKDGLMGQTGANEAYVRTENGNLQYKFASGGVSVAQWGIDIQSAYDGEFHAIAVVLDRTAGEIRAYLDGALLHTNTDSNIALLGEMLDGTSDFRLGAYNATGVDAFNGLQDRYRISSFARDPADLLPADPSAPVNQAPVFTVDPINEANATEDIAYAGSVANATDADGDTLSYSKLTGPAWLSVGTDGSLSGTPAQSDVGANAFTVQVDDGNGGTDTATLNITVDATAGGPGVRVTEYYLTTGDFSGTTATLTLDQDLADDYYILIRGSRVGDGLSEPDNDYARVTAVPGGKGDLPDSGATDQITLGRWVADFDWEGVVTVVECDNSASAAGFKLVDVVETPLTAASGTDSSAAWTDLSRVVLFGGYRGGGAALTESTSSRNQGSSVYVRLYPSGTGTLNWSRNAAGETIFNAVMTTFVVEWGSEWTVQHVNVAGANGGNGANATGEYTTAAISSVTRDNSWVWATGTRLDAGIGDCSEACLVTLGDGVSQNASESTVAVGSEYSDAYDFDVYVLTHSAIAVDHVFVADGNQNVLDVPVTVDTTTAGARFGWVYNGVNGTGSYHPRSRFWARYTADDEVTISHGFDGQNFPAWVQGVDLSGLNQ